MNRQLLVFLIPMRLACRGCSDRPANQNPQYAGYCCQGCEAGADHEDWCMPVAPQAESPATPQTEEGCYGCCPTLAAEVERLRRELLKPCSDCGSPDRTFMYKAQKVGRGLRPRPMEGLDLTDKHKRATIEQIKRTMDEALTPALMFEPLTTDTLQKAETTLTEALSPQWLYSRGIIDAQIRAAGYADESRIDVNFYYTFEDAPRTTRVITYSLVPGNYAVRG